MVWAASKMIKNIIYMGSFAMNAIAMLVGADTLGNIPAVLSGYGIEIHRHLTGRNSAHQRKQDRLPAGTGLVDLVYRFSWAQCDEAFSLAGCARKHPLYRLPPLVVRAATIAGQRRFCQRRLSTRQANGCAQRRARAGKRRGRGFAAQQLSGACCTRLCCQWPLADVVSRPVLGRACGFLRLDALTCFMVACWL